MIEHIAFYQFKSISEEFVARGEVIENDDLMTGAAKRSRSVTADVSRTTDD